MADHLASIDPPAITMLLQAFPFSAIASLTHASQLFRLLSPSQLWSFKLLRGWSKQHRRGAQLAAAQKQE